MLVPFSPLGCGLPPKWSSPPPLFQVRLRSTLAQGTDSLASLFFLSRTVNWLASVPSLIPEQKRTIPSPFSPSHKPLGEPDLKGNIASSWTNYIWGLLSVAAHPRFLHLAERPSYERSCGSCPSVKTDGVNGVGYCQLQPVIFANLPCLEVSFAKKKHGWIGVS